MTEKTCHGCGQTKPASDFYKSSSSKDGLAPSCKDCQNGRTPKTGIPKDLVPPVFKAPSPQKIPKAPAPTQTPDTHQEVPLEEPEVLEQQDDHLKAKDWVWWNDPDRKQTLHPDIHWDAPRAGTIISINNGTGTAIVGYFRDPTAERIEEKALAQITDLRRRTKYY